MEMFRDPRYAVVTGAAGTGKSETTARALADQAGYAVITGRAGTGKSQAVVRALADQSRLTITPVHASKRQ